MSRVLSAPVISLLQAVSRAHHQRVRFAPPGGEFVDLTDYLLPGTVHEEGINEPVDMLVLHFDRSIGSASLSPLMTENPPIDVNFDVIWEVAVTSQTADPSSGDWIEKFRGSVWDIDATHNDMVVTCEGLMGKLRERLTLPGQIIEADTELEDAIQEVLDGPTPPLGLTLSVPTSPDASLDQDLAINHEPVLQAALGLAGSIGWAFRYWWDETEGEFRPTLLEPPRDKVDPDWTTSASRYIAVPEFRRSKADVRNAVAVYYGAKGADGEQAAVMAKDDSSIAAFGLQEAILREGSDSPIQNAAQAQALANAFISDLAWPDITHTITDFDLPNIQLWDLIELAPNNAHYNTTQRYAVQSIRREFPTLGAARITLGLRGKPSAGIGAWRRRRTTAPDVVPSVMDIRFLTTEGNDRRYRVLLAPGFVAYVYWMLFEDVETQEDLPEDWFEQMTASVQVIVTESGDEFTAPEPGRRQLLRGVVVPRLATPTISGEYPAAGDGWDFGADGTEPPITVSSPSFDEASDGLSSTFAVDIDDPRGAVSGVGVYLTVAGIETGPFAATYAAGTYNYTFDLHPDHVVGIRARVNRNDGGDPIWIGPYSADTDKTPGIPVVRESRDGATVTLRVDSHDTDTVSQWRREVIGGVAGSETLIPALGSDPRFGAFVVTADDEDPRVFRVYGKNSAGVVGPYAEVTVGPHTTGVTEEEVQELLTPLGAIIRSGTEPTTRLGGSALQEGDLWINTADGSSPYSWEGADWIPAEIDGAKIYGVLAAGVIFAGEVTSIYGSFTELEVEDWLRSLNYSAGVSGFHLDGPTGHAELNSVTIRDQVNKAIRISHHGFRPGNAAGTVDYAAAINNTSLNATGEGDFYAPVILPVGAVVTSITFRGMRGGASNTCTATLYRQSSTGTVTGLGTVTHTAAGMQTTQYVLASPETVGTTGHYLVEVYLDWAGGTAPAFEYIEVAYTAANYRQTL